MQKAVSATHAQKRLSNNSRSLNIPELTTESKLYNYITQQRLSDSLELLEMQGYLAEDAICRIQYLQMEGIC
jgi:hypothetical protein